MSKRRFDTIFIGNDPIETERTLGEFIDKRFTVIRIGDFFIDDPLKTGSKTDIWFTKTGNGCRDVGDIDKVYYIIDKEELVTSNHKDSIPKPIFLLKSHLKNYKRHSKKDEKYQATLCNKVELILRHSFLLKVSQFINLPSNLRLISFELISLLYMIQRYHKILIYNLSFETEIEKRIINKLIQRGFIKYV